MLVGEIISYDNKLMKGRRLDVGKPEAVLLLTPALPIDRLVIDVRNFPYGRLGGMHRV